MNLAAREPLGTSRLGDFWHQALQLIESEAGQVQEVVTLIAAEGGMIRVAETIGQEFELMSDHRLKSVFDDHLMPFFRVMTHRNVTASAILHTKVMSIYNFIFGVGGQTAVQLFTGVVRHLSSLSLSSDDSNETDVESNLGRIEATLGVMNKVIEVNSTAKVTEGLVTPVEFLDTMLQNARTEALATQWSSIFVYLERAKQRLSQGQALGEHSKPDRMNQNTQATFTVARERPGELSEDGPRHDNDSTDIKDISILPTVQELQCARAEYLPCSDPQEWHLEGLRGLIDRHFRLLREDTIGQLRDAASREFEHIYSSRQTTLMKPKDHGLRTLTYPNTYIVNVDVDQRNGLILVLAFDQPRELRARSLKQRREWWESSRRLSTDALVCLISSDDMVIFLVITERGSDSSAERDDKQHYDLWSDPGQSYVTAKLAIAEGSGYLVDRLPHVHSAKLSLVEFPGVLLPAFLPTLRALQRMSNSLDVPFADMLAPEGSDGDLVDVPPPRYAMRRGFYFDLSVITKGEGRMQCRPGTHFDVQSLQENSTLDCAQANALVTSLNRSLALVQGPPGTGKSYTGVTLIRVLLHNKRKASLGPILCVCFTNHALDQLLEHLLDCGVEQIVRVGAGSKSDRLKDVNLRELAQKLPRTKTEKKEQWHLIRELESESNEVKRLLSRLASLGNGAQVEELLGSYYHSHHQQLFGSTDEDGFMRAHKDRNSIVTNWIKGHDPAIRGNRRSVKELRDSNLRETSSEERRLLYHSWLDQIKSTTQNQLHTALASYHKLKENLAAVRAEVDLRVLRTANVVGITTSGLAQKLHYLRRIESKVVICEEAGEVLEAHLLTALLPNIQHAIFIGDHQQLRPQVQNYALSAESKDGKQYRFDVSLFERLVAPCEKRSRRMPYCTLEIQRRMHPSISDLIRSTLYPRLQDDASVADYPAVPGLRRRLFWMHHETLEDERDAQVTSHTNKFEVEMIAALVSHLVRQGVYKSTDVAVLTPYLGQLRKIKNRLGSSFEIVLGDRDVDDLQKEDAGDSVAEPSISATTSIPSGKSSLLQALRIATVDNFQGEEAKVVIISLVRSNKKGSCGFLKTSNRINVLLSRAQHGMYIIGNAKTARHVPMWAQVLDIFEEQGNFGEAFELCCPRHPETLMSASRPEHFLCLAPEAGCSLPCTKQLSCGHACVSKCHSDLLHQTVFCQKPCTRPRKECNHNCALVCGATCADKCKVIVQASELELACGHRKDKLPCYQYLQPALIECDVLMNKQVLSCNHMVLEQCHVNVGDVSFRCREVCGVPLACGHTCARRCHECRTYCDEGEIEADHGRCRQSCGRKYNTCRHHCRALCHGKDSGCPLCTEKCEVRCSHSQCTRKCSEPCLPCAEEVCGSHCEHSECAMPCSAPCDRLICGRRCSKTLGCGHKCEYSIVRNIEHC